MTATGQLNPVVNVQVGSQISGRIQKLFVDYNSVVKSNQIIAEIDPSTYKVNVQRAQAQVAQSKANLALAEVQAKRGRGAVQRQIDTRGGSRHRDGAAPVGAGADNAG